MVKECRMYLYLAIGDSSATARVVLWEESIGKLEEDQSYNLNGVVVREHQGKKFLSTAKENTIIEN